MVLGRIWLLFLVLSFILFFFVVDVKTWYLRVKDRGGKKAPSTFQKRLTVHGSRLFSSVAACLIFVCTLFGLKLLCGVFVWEYVDDAFLSVRCETCGSRLPTAEFNTWAPNREEHTRDSPEIKDPDRSPRCLSLSPFSWSRVTWTWFVFGAFWA